MTSQDLFKIHKIRIVKVPAGEAPEWVRKAWVSLEIPTFENINFPVVSTGDFGALSRVVKLEKSVYYVKVLDALMLLTDQKAEEWWHENCPDLCQDGILFAFAEEECELV